MNPITLLEWGITQYDSFLVFFCSMIVLVFIFLIVCVFEVWLVVNFGLIGLLFPVLILYLFINYSYKKITSSL